MLNINYIFSSINFLFLFFIIKQFYCVSNAPEHELYAGALDRQFTYILSYEKIIEISVVITLNMVSHTRTNS